MKINSISVILLLVLSTVIGCKKDDQNGGAPYVKFQESEVLLTNAPGTSVVTVVSNYSQWELSTDENGFISNLRFLQGGSLDYSNTTRVKFDHAENNTSNDREQVVKLKNITTGDVQEVIVKQSSKPPVVLNINTETSFQQITGFGGMLNPALWQGNNQLTEAEIDQLYGPGGLGYNMMRIMIYPDPANWSRDLAIAKKAQSLGVRIFGSPWSPPAYMKSSGQQSGGSGGYLLPAYYDAYAKHLNDFVDYMAANGVTIEAVSIQNEPDWDPDYDACVWTGQQILDFMRDHGHKIKVKVIAAEAVNFKKEYTDPTLNNAVARENLDIVGTHLYGGGITDYPLARQYGKEIWMTEHLMNTNNANDWSWDHALTFGKELHDCMEANFNAYIWWYLKRHYSMLGDGEYKSEKGKIMHRGYVMAHYARYATGRKRISVDKIQGNSNFLITAYEGTNDYTVIIQNQGTTYVPTLQLDLPNTVSAVSAIESTGDHSIVNKSITLVSDKKSVVINIIPKSVVSIKITK